MAKRITKAEQARIRADKFRSTVAGLLECDIIWSAWEENWLISESRRRPDYIFSEKEHVVLDRMRIAASGPFTNYGEYTVTELIAIAYRWRFELDEDGEEFLETLHKTAPTGLRKRPLRRLAGICRSFEGLDLPRDINAHMDALAELEKLEGQLVSVPFASKQPGGDHDAKL
jgi:hypothetical protein